MSKKREHFSSPFAVSSLCLEELLFGHSVLLFFCCNTCSVASLSQSLSSSLTFQMKRKEVEHVLLFLIDFFLLKANIARKGSAKMKERRPVMKGIMKNMKKRRIKNRK
jgi:hypothetical protein